MKLTESHLRKIIRQEIRSALREGSTIPTADYDVTMQVVPFVVETLVDHLDDFALGKEAFKRWQQALGEENMTVPVRHEDVDSYSREMADEILADPDLREAIETLLSDTLTNAMVAV